MVQSTRRSFLTGLGTALVAAPAIVRAGSLMPVKTMIEKPALLATWELDVFYFYDGMRMFKSVAGRDWVDVSSEYYKQPPFKGSIGEYQSIKFH